MKELIAKNQNLRGVEKRISPLNESQGQTWLYIPNKIK
jgi:hypothetical protein